MSRRNRAWHVPDALLDRFAAIDEPALPAPDLWSVEAHLERCPDCRARLAEVMPARSPHIATLVRGVHTELDARIAAVPAPAARPRRRLARRLTGGLLISRLLACVAVLLAATLLDLAAGAGASGAPSWVLLAAPVLPLLGVAASWSRVFDPAYDLVAATPAAGLSLLLWRTAVVLAVIVPAALLAGVVTDARGMATWLLPCLALTAAALALGSVTGMVRATSAAAGAWAAAVVAPALAMQETPAALEPAWLPVWVTLIILAAGAIMLRRNAYRRLLG
ncbi:MAG: hypothetical protein QOD83_2220 [Solirubrobacteraceae bacterium]|jgi:hypothetical protein|nr:hypothetical protein [Solirubrobacteraceae bacterium]